MELLFESMFMTVRLLLAGIPEAVGVLVFAAGLILTTVLIRRVTTRAGSDSKDETTKKA